MRSFANEIFGAKVSSGEHENKRDRKRCTLVVISLDVEIEGLVPIQASSIMAVTQLSPIDGEIL